MKFRNVPHKVDYDPLFWIEPNLLVKKKKNYRDGPVSKSAISECLLPIFSPCIDD